MDHAYFEERQTAQRYLEGRLSLEETEHFEDHYLTCDTCLDELELADRFDRAMKGAAAEDAARATVAARLGLLARLARLSPPQQAAVGFVLLLVLVLLPGGLLTRQLRHLDHELDRARLTLDEWQERQAEERQDLEERLRQMEGGTAEHRRLGDELEQERQRNERLAQELERARSPQANVPVVRLSPERSGPGQDEPTLRLTLSPGLERIVLVLESQGPDYRRYGLTLVGPRGQVAWRGRDLEPSPLGDLTLSLPTALLEEGDSVLRLEGLPADGEPLPLATFPLRVVRARGGAPPPG